MAEIPMRAVSNPFTHAFAQPAGDLGREPVAHKLLDDAIANRNTAGDRQMANDVTGQTPETKCGWASAI